MNFFTFSLNWNVLIFVPLKIREIYVVIFTDDDESFFSLEEIGNAISLHTQKMTPNITPRSR